MLRRPRKEDAREIYERYAADPEVTRYLVWRPHKSMEETEIFLNRCTEVWNNSVAFPWVIVPKENGHVAGMLEIRIAGHIADLGYVLAKPFWRRGYMTEAVREVVNWAFSQPSIYRIWAVCDVDNPASLRVLEKVGMKSEGILKRWIIHPNIASEPRDSYCYALTK